MATENYVDFSAVTAVAMGGYTSGSGVLNVTSTGSPFPSAGQFSVVITDQTTGLTKVLLRVSAVNSGTQWAVTAEGSDANASAGDNVYAVLSAAGLDGIRADCNQTGTRASLPSTTGQKAGNRYKCTDSPYEFIFDGSAWQPFIFGYRVDEPLSGSFSWGNQGSASLTTTNGGMLLKAPPNSSDSLRCQNQATISAPYTCDIAFVPAIFNANYCGAGVHLLNSGNGKIVSVGLFNTGSTVGNLTLRADYWNSTTSHNAGENLITGASAFNIFGLSPLIWMRIYDNNTNRSVYFSLDGVVFNLVYQESRTNFITPDTIGFFIDNNDSTSNLWSTLWAVHFNNYSGAPPTTGYSV